MYLHLGQDTVIRTGAIVGIFDPDTSTVSARTRRTLALMEKRGDIALVSDGLPKAFVLCTQEKGASTLYLSDISVQTLAKRLEEE